ncbi:hypothetical protein [Hyphococcus sp.]|uniref:hypothetical protein n=1 Tax=Hyphococcus sp. TaxID=2038636 RepID=UPI002080C721|nr:MAG: hypothetical protein DHS20C04_20270 [Marinicaulis sp.]
MRLKIPLSSSLAPSLALLALTACAPANNAGESDADAVLEEDIIVDTAEVADCPVIDSRNWHAWVDAMPGPDSKPILHVSGEVDMPTPGYSFDWRDGAADRSATPVQRLMLTVTPPDAMTTQVITSEQVKYEGAAIAKMYRGILVICGGRVLADLPDVSITE